MKTNTNTAHDAVDTSTAEIAAAGPDEQDPNTITLDEPITRGSQVIEKVTLRRPGAGELRGTSLSALLDLSVDALHKVIPRISSPTLTERDVANLCPADLVKFGSAVMDFLLSKDVKAQMASRIS